MSVGKHTSEYFRQVNVWNLQTHIDIQSYLLVTLGIIGNLFGLFIFLLSHRARRRSSVYVCFGYLQCHNQCFMCYTLRFYVTVISQSPVDVFLLVQQRNPRIYISDTGKNP